MKIGIFGGTFDPTHKAHIALAQHALEELKLDQVRLIPCNQTVHRDQPIASAQQRLEMTRLAIEGNDKLILDDREIKRDGPSYMIDTLKSLTNDFPNDELYLIMGSDAYQCFDHWKDPQGVKALATLVVAGRPGYTLENTDDIITLNFPELDIAATQIREAAKDEILNLTLPQVAAFITKEELYEH